MKKIQLTKGYEALVDDKDFDWLNEFKWKYSKYKKDRTGYAIRFEYIKGSSNKQCKYGKKRRISMHREILGLKKGDNKISDHINHNGLDNQRCNLRICNHKENSRNKLSYKNSSSKFLGVFLFRLKTKCKYKTVTGVEKTYPPKEYTYWRAVIENNGKREVIGNFKNEIDAAKAWNERAKIIYGEFANLNLIPPS